jgi:hypothetical protein
MHASHPAARSLCTSEQPPLPGLQVLLSCSHVLHAQCLASFERHTRTKCCPLCRKQGYQKIIIRDAEEAFQHTCAIKIQAAARGWLARRRVWEMRQWRPPADAALRRQWGAARLQVRGTPLALHQQ